MRNAYVNKHFGIQWARQQIVALNGSNELCRVYDTPRSSTLVNVVVIGEPNDDVTKCVHPMAMRPVYVCGECGGDGEIHLEGWWVRCPCCNGKRFFEAVKR